MEQTTENIKIESDTFALKREYKYAFENFTSIKKEVAEVLTVKEKVSNELFEAEKELTKVRNDISQQKLDWANYRGAELKELEDKKSAAENILKRKSELNEQEESIRKVEETIIEARNETRRNELKIEEEKIALNVKEKEVKEREEKIKIEKEILEKNKLDFKNKVVEVLNKVNEL